MANQLQKREPMSSPDWHLQFPLFSPVIFTPAQEEIEEAKKRSGLRNTSMDIPDTSQSLPTGPGPSPPKGRACKRRKSPFGQPQEVPAESLVTANHTGACTPGMLLTGCQNDRNVSSAAHRRELACMGHGSAGGTSNSRNTKTSNTQAEPL